jgi:hypothetical protein
VEGPAPGADPGKPGRHQRDGCRRLDNSGPCDGRQAYRKLPILWRRNSIETSVPTPDMDDTDSHTSRTMYFLVKRTRIHNILKEEVSYLDYGNSLP